MDVEISKATIIITVQLIEWKNATQNESAKKKEMEERLSSQKTLFRQAFYLGATCDRFYCSVNR